MYFIECICWYIGCKSMHSMSSIKLGNICSQTHKRWVRVALYQCPYRSMFVTLCVWISCWRRPHEACYSLPVNMINKKAAERTRAVSSALCADVSRKSMRRHNGGCYCDYFAWAVYFFFAGKCDVLGCGPGNIYKWVKTVEFWFLTHLYKVWLIRTTSCIYFFYVTCWLRTRVWLIYFPLRKGSNFVIIISLLYPRIVCYWHH